MTIEEIFARWSQNTEFSVQYPEKSVRSTSTSASVPAYMKTAVAFANGRGGRIVFGIDGKTREVAGIPEDKVFQVMDAVTNMIADSCEPALIPDVWLQEINGRPVIIAELWDWKRASISVLAVLRGWLTVILSGGCTMSVAAARMTRKSEGISKSTMKISGSFADS